MRLPAAQLVSAFKNERNKTKGEIQDGGSQESQHLTSLVDMKEGAHSCLHISTHFTKKNTTTCVCFKSQLSTCLPCCASTVSGVLGLCFLNQVRIKSFKMTTKCCFSTEFVGLLDLIVFSLLFLCFSCTIKVYFNCALSKKKNQKTQKAEQLNNNATPMNNKSCVYV